MPGTPYSTLQRHGCSVGAAAWGPDNASARSHRSTETISEHPLGEPEPRNPPASEPQPGLQDPWPQGSAYHYRNKHPCEHRLNCMHGLLCWSSLGMEAAALSQIICAKAPDFTQCHSTATSKFWCPMRAAREASGSRQANPRWSRCLKL